MKEYLIEIIAIGVALIITAIIFIIMLKVAKNYLKKATKKTYRNDITNEKLKFLNFCEHQTSWRRREIIMATNFINKFKQKNKINTDFPEVVKSGIYAIYINDIQNDTFLPCYIGKSETILGEWFDIIQYIQKNIRKNITHLSADLVETKIISYLKEFNFKIKDIHFAVLKNIANDKNIDAETNILIKKFETDKNGWN